MTTLTFEPVIEGMTDRSREPWRDADIEEHTDKRDSEEQTQRMKELMNGNFRTGMPCRIIQKFLEVLSAVYSYT
jgi:hypothetical protein